MGISSFRFPNKESQNFPGNWSYQRVNEIHEATPQKSFSNKQKTGKAIKKLLL